MSRSLGTLTLDLVARTGGWVRGMDASERRTQRWRRQVEREVKAAGKAVAAAASAALAGLTLLTRQGMNFVDEQAKTARALDGTVNGLRAAQQAANDAGMSNQTFAGSVERLNRELVRARDEGGRSADALESIGLRASDLLQMDVDQRLATIADAIHGMGLSSAETSDLMRDLGVRTGAMGQLLRGGGDAFRAARQEVRDFGLAMTEIETQKVEAANDALSRLPRLLEPLKNQLALTLAEPITDITGRINAAARETNGFERSIVQAMATAVEWAQKAFKAIDSVYLALQKVRLFQLGAEALGEQVRMNITGQGMGRMQNYGLDNDAPATGPKTAAYNALAEQLEEYEKQGGMLRDISDELGKTLASIEQRGRDIESGARDTLMPTNEEAGRTAKALEGVAIESEDLKDETEDLKEETKSAKDSLEDFTGAAETGARAIESATAGLGGGGVDPAVAELIRNAGAPMKASERIALDRALPTTFALPPNPSARPTWSTDYLTDTGISTPDLAAQVEAAAAWGNVGRLEPLGGSPDFLDWAIDGVEVKAPTLEDHATDANQHLDAMNEKVRTIGEHVSKIGEQMTRNGEGGGSVHVTLTLGNQTAQGDMAKELADLLTSVASGTAAR